MDKMRRKLLLTLLVLATTGLQSAYARDFFAVVDRIGQLVRPSPQTVSVSHSNTGQFEVTFNADVSGCSYTASIGDPFLNGAVNDPGLVFTAGGHLSSKGVYVETKNMGGGLSDFPFHLSVNCTSKYAVVNANGTLSRGDFDVQSVTHLGTGRYEVAFAVPVDSCGYLATIGDPGNALVFNPGLVFTAGGHQSANGVYVETKNLSGQLADYPFHLSATCASTFAVVNGSTLIRGDAQSVTRLDVGQYEINFAVTLDSCAYTATIGDPANGAVANPGLIFTAGGHGSENGVFVETKDIGGNFSDFPFHLRSTCPSAWGFADLHTHPAAHLALGADRQNGVNGALWGKPAHDGGMDLATSSQQANLASDLDPCPSASVGPIGLGFTHNNSAGIDFVKLMTDAQIVAQLDGTAPPGWTHQSEGFPSFGRPQAGWPAALTVNHQVMHINSIKRAFDGGLRLMFAAAVEDELISDVWNQGFNLFGNAAPIHDPSFDFKSASAQLQYITNLVNANSSWMQIVRTPSEARAAITSNPPKLAVVLSLEMDSLSLPDIQTLVQQFGVAHVIPIHLADNSFGGTAVFSDIFNGLSKFLNGSFLTPVNCNNSPQDKINCNNVNFSLGSPGAHIEPVNLSTTLNLSSGQVAAVDIALIGAAAFGPAVASTVAFWAALGAIGIQVMPTGALGYLPIIPTPAPIQTPGQINNRDLNHEQFSVLMNMGLLLDVAHMGQKSAGSALAMAQKYHYPLMDSHTGIRCDSPFPIDCSTPFGSAPSPLPSGGAVVNERSLPTSQVRIIKQLGGVVGLGVVPGTSGNPPVADPDPVTTWIKNYSIVLSFMGGKGVALGTDANGLSPLIHKDTIPTSSPDNYQITVASDFGCPTCLPLPMYQLGLPPLSNHKYDFEKDGIANYGLSPDFIQAASKQGRCSCQPCGTNCPVLPDPTPQITALFQSAEDTIEMWEKVAVAAKGVPKPEPVQCFVFDDEYTNQAGPSDAVYIKTRSAGDTSLPACVPSDSATGICHKWFGRCFTTQTNVPVYFHVFDDGNQNDGGMSDAVFMLRPKTACVPANNGTCRKWFGQGITRDGRKVTCSLFDDGYTNLAGPTDAIYSLGILNQPNLEACLPDGTTTGLCRKWFGRCNAFAGQ